jgi:hypothetical protein
MADFSTVNGPQSQLSAPAPFPLVLLSNMSNLMSLKLNSFNYIIWKLQLTTILNAYLMIDHIDGSVQKPSQFLVDIAGNLTTRANPSYVSWKKHDKALLTLIYSTLSPPILAMLIVLNTAQEVWSNLVLLHTEEQSINESSEMNSALAMFVTGTNKHNNGNSGFNRGKGRNSYQKGRGGRSNSYSFNP